MAQYGGWLSADYETAMKGVAALIAYCCWIGLAQQIVIPKCPKHLDENARKEWRRISQELHRLNLLTIVDRAALAAYCQAWGRWVEAEAAIQRFGAVIKTPKGLPLVNPYLRIAELAIDQMRKFLVEFGMTLSSR